MEERLLEIGTNFTIENLVNRINEVIGEKFSVLDAQDDIEKWNQIPKLFLLEEVVQNKILSFVEYMDNLLIPVSDKAIFVVSLVGLIEFTDISILDYEDGNLFLLADYYQNSSIEEIRSTFGMIRSQKILSTIRNKSLDLDIRKNLLSSFINQIKSAKIENWNEENLLSYLQDLLK